jgi:hypothetical protein
MAARNPLPSAFVEWLKAFISLGAISAFAYVFVNAILQVWAAKSGQTPTVDPALLYVGTLLAAMVGGFFAVALGLSPPPPPPPPNTQTRAGTPNTSETPPPQTTRRLSLAPSRVTRLDLGGGFLGAIDTRAIIAVIYALVYLGISVAACFTWLSHSPETSDLVKSLATTFIGLAIGTATNYLRG